MLAMTSMSASSGTNFSGKSRTCSANSCTLNGSCAVSSSGMAQPYGSCGGRRPSKNRRGAGREQDVGDVENRQARCVRCKVRCDQRGCRRDVAGQDVAGVDVQVSQPRKVHTGWAARGWVERDDDPRRVEAQRQVCQVCVMLSRMPLRSAVRMTTVRIRRVGAVRSKICENRPDEIWEKFSVWGRGTHHNSGRSLSVSTG